MVFFAILGGGASLFIKKNKLVGFFRWIATGILIVTMLSAWFAPNLPQAVESYQPGTSVTSPAQEEQVAPTPVEEMPSTERVVVARRKIQLIGDGEHMIPVNFTDNNKYICFLNLGMENGDARKSQFLTINGVEYSSLGEGCYKIKENLSGKFNIKFFPNPEFGNLSLYEYWRNQPGGKGILPYIAIE